MTFTLIRIPIVDGRDLQQRRHGLMHMNQHAIIVTTRQEADSLLILTNWGLQLNVYIGTDILIHTNEVSLNPSDSIKLIELILKNNNWYFVMNISSNAAIMIAFFYIRNSKQV